MGPFRIVADYTAGEGWRSVILPNMKNSKYRATATHGSVPVLVASFLKLTAAAILGGNANIRPTHQCSEAAMSAFAWPSVRRRNCRALPVKQGGAVAFDIRGNQKRSDIAE